MRDCCGQAATPRSGSRIASRTTLLGGFDASVCPRTASRLGAIFAVVHTWFLLLPAYALSPSLTAAGIAVAPVTFMPLPRRWRSDIEPLRRGLSKELDNLLDRRETAKRAVEYALARNGEMVAAWLSEPKSHSADLGPQFAANVATFEANTLHLATLARHIAGGGNDDAVFWELASAETAFAGIAARNAPRYFNKRAKLDIVDADTGQQRADKIRLAKEAEAARLTWGSARAALTADLAHALRHQGRFNVGDGAFNIQIASKAAAAFAMRHAQKVAGVTAAAPRLEPDVLRPMNYLQPIASAELAMPKLIGTSSGFFAIASFGKRSCRSGNARDWLTLMAIAEIERRNQSIIAANRAQQNGMLFVPHYDYKAIRTISKSGTEAVSAKRSLVGLWKHSRPRLILKPELEHD